MDAAQQLGCQLIDPHVASTAINATAQVTLADMGFDD